MIVLAVAPTAEAEEGICKGFAGDSGGLKYAGVKCALKSNPGNYVIRNTVWEKKDPEVYKAYLPVANRTFTCELTQSGGSTNTTYEIIRYTLSNCH